ncbi:MAG: MFS transporter, partial [Pseudomonadota bacterium]|nr:MFS transporter [Pseudomonadota bacterium]
MNKKEVKVCSLLIAIFSLRIFGLMMIVPVLPVYLHTLDSDNSVFLGLIIGIYGFTQALLQIPLGYLSDIVGRKKVIFGGLLMLCFGSFIAYLAQSAYLMILGRAIQGAGAIGSTILAAISDHTSEKNRTLAMAFLGASVGISFFLSLIIGPVVASKF